MLAPFNLKQWIDENRHLLKPPVGNQVIYKHNQDFIVMVVGGPNSRKDYHFNKGEELFFQLEGDIVLKVVHEGVFKDVIIKEGDMFLLPPQIPHCPQRPAGTIGLVIERYRNEEELDSFLWYCESCGNQLHKSNLALKDIVVELPLVMNAFYNNDKLTTCTNCGHKMNAPVKLT